MANYVIVVPRGNTDLLDLLSVAFRGHTGFNVVVDRRGVEEAQGASNGPALSSPNVPAERRGGRLALGRDEIVVAERADRADRPVSGGDGSRSFQRIPVRRRRARRSGAEREGGSQPGLSPMRSSSRAVTAC